MQAKTVRSGNLSLIIAFLCLITFCTGQAHSRANKECGQMEKGFGWNGGVPISSGIGLGAINFRQQAQLAHDKAKVAALNDWNRKVRS
ncbi:MAG: hypothetical protein WBD37_09020, partial [Anderseniella sp.]